MRRSYAGLSNVARRLPGANSLPSPAAEQGACFVDKKRVGCASQVDAPKLLFEARRPQPQRPRPVCEVGTPPTSPLVPSYPPPRPRAPIPLASSTCTHLPSSVSWRASWAPCRPCAPPPHPSPDTPPHPPRTDLGRLLDVHPLAVVHQQELVAAGEARDGDEVHRAGAVDAHARGGLLAARDVLQLVAWRGSWGPRGEAQGQV